MESLAIDVRNLTKRYEGRAVVNGVDLQVRTGRVCGFLGPNGSGKTTTIRMLCGLLTPDAGEGAVLGLDLQREALAIKRQVGYMTQKFGLYEDLTVKENMELYARMHGVSGQDREKRFRSLLSMTNLERFTTRLAGKLSGGMKQ